MMRFWTPRTLKISKKHKEFIAFRENRVFCSERPPGPKKYQKQLQNDSQMEPEMLPKRQKIMKKSMPKSMSISASFFYRSDPIWAPFGTLNGQFFRSERLFFSFRDVIFSPFSPWGGNLGPKGGQGTKMEPKREPQDPKSTQKSSKRPAATPKST